jgi:hypothetical protein
MPGLSHDYLKLATNDEYQSEYEGEGSETYELLPEAKYGICFEASPRL